MGQIVEAVVAIAAGVTAAARVISAEAVTVVAIANSLSPPLETMRHVLKYGWIC